LKIIQLLLSKDWGYNDWLIHLLILNIFYCWLVLILFIVKYLLIYKALHDSCLEEKKLFPISYNIRAYLYFFITIYSILVIRSWWFYLFIKFYIINIYFNLTGYLAVIWTSHMTNFSFSYWIILNLVFVFILIILDMKVHGYQINFCNLFNIQYSLAIYDFLYFNI
jgi:hypothetical protein